MLCGSDDFIERAAVWRTRYGGRLVSTTMITVDMASSMRECLRSDTFQKSFDVLCAVAEGVQRLDEPRLRFDPAVPQSAMTHVCVRCPGSPAKGERPEALLAAAEALRHILSTTWLAPTPTPWRCADWPHLGSKLAT